MEENTKNEKTCQVYEIGFHILPTIPEEKIQETVSKLVGLINQNGGGVISEEFPKMRALSYEIKKRVETKVSSFDKAYFGWIKFEAAPDAVVKIKKEISNDGNILRFIIIKTVRENTIQIFKSSISISKEGNKGEIKAPREKTEISEEEIDKSIDELLVNES